MQFLFTGKDLKVLILWAVPPRIQSFRFVGTGTMQEVQVSWYFDVVPLRLVSSCAGELTA